jgi:two-component system, chemotaxis family, chemotaxis protein CheY
MTSVSQLLHQIADPTLTHNERARLRCQLAKELEDAGNYEAAREAMGDLWLRVGDHPTLQDLDEDTAAEVLLRAGVLTGWIGCVKQVEDAQESAKNLISESIARFQALDISIKVAEAQTEIGYCYWREGAFDEARIILNEALSRMANRADDLKALALLRLAIVEKVTLRLNDALQLLMEAAPILDKSSNHSLRGRLHNELTAVLVMLGEAERRSDYTDRALIEAAAASYHFEQAGHRRYQAYVENNLGMLFCTLGRYSDAHQHLDRAQALFTSMRDRAHIAQVDDTRAKVLLAEGRVADAEKLVRLAVRTLEKSGQQSLWAEAMTTHGIALARLGQHPNARLTLQSAVEVAQTAGDLEGAGQTSLTIIEELGAHLPAQDLSATFDLAAELLTGTQHPATKDRLVICARRVMHLIGVLPTPPKWKGFSLHEAVRRFESPIIERALREAGGVVARAAQLLGINRQTLDTMLRVGRHKDLLHLRTPVAPRRTSLMFRDELNCPDTRAVSVLHVEDDALVSEGVRVALEDEGWSVETCGDGAAALERLQSSTRYDVLIFDNNLPDIDGIELIRRTRALAHRQQTPIIVFSGDDVETRARRAGATAFLLKLTGTPLIAETVARLLARKKGSEG